MFRTQTRTTLFITVTTWLAASLLTVAAWMAAPVPTNAAANVAAAAEARRVPAGPIVPRPICLHYLCDSNVA